MKIVIVIALIALAMGANAQYYQYYPSLGIRDPVAVPQLTQLQLQGQYPYHPFAYRPILIRPPIESSSVVGAVVPGGSVPLSPLPATLAFKWNSLPKVH